MNIRLSKEQKIRILNSQDVYNVMQQVLKRENKIRRSQEHFWVLGLDQKNSILFVELISLGGASLVQVNPPEVFRMGIYKMAVRMILVHNHPSGNLQPSQEDKNVTDHLLKAGNLINIEVIDHLIISEKGYTSFADAGIMEALRNSGLYELLDSEKAAMKRWKEAMERERAVKENSLEIAKKMKSKGYETKIIQELTGLGKREIDKI